MECPCRIWNMLEILHELTCFFSSGKSTLTLSVAFPFGLRIECGSASSLILAAFFTKVVDA